MRISKQIIKILRLFFFICLSAICLLSIFAYIKSTKYLDIEKFVIRQGKFNISCNKYNYTFKTRFSQRYNLLLTIFEEEIDYDILFNMIKKFNIDINVNLKENSEIIKNELKNQKNLECCHYFGDSFSLCLLAFDSAKDKKYEIQIEFNIDTDYFNGKLKKLFIQKDYDFASIPWAKDLKKISFVTFCICLCLIVIIILFYCIKKSIKRR